MGIVRFKGSGREISVGKIVCMGQNYAKHVEELKTRIPDKPMLFFKPSTALLGPDEPIRLPQFSSNIHYEAELVALIGKRARYISASEALQFVGGYAVGLDLTARDVQSEARKRGEAWAVAKGFDGSAPVSEITSAEDVGDPGDLSIELRLNEEIRQSARTSEMIFKIPDIIAYASGIFTLEPGDLVFTGTPSGVGAIRSGDILEARIERVGTARWKVS
jgi:2-keto-4-pentenoate hydratase/2-oxohepta-3-ene-1,7-dioic acid hydratase in catechol pathway